MKRKILSVLLAVLMILPAFPQFVFADSAVYVNANDIIEDVNLSNDFETDSQASDWQYANVPTTPPEIVEDPSDASNKVLKIVSNQNGGGYTEYFRTFDYVKQTGEEYVIKFSVRGGVDIPSPWDWGYSNYFMTLFSGVDRVNIPYTWYVGGNYNLRISGVKQNADDESVMSNKELANHKSAWKDVELHYTPGNKEINITVSTRGANDTKTYKYYEKTGFLSNPNRISCIMQASTNDAGRMITYIDDFSFKTVNSLKAGFVENNNIEILEGGAIHLKFSKEVSKIALSEKLAVSGGASSYNLVMDDVSKEAVVYPVGSGNSTITVLSGLMPQDGSGALANSVKIDFKINQLRETEVLQLLDFENDSDLSKITSTLSSGSRLEIVQDPDDAANKVLKVSVAPNTTPSDVYTKLKIATNDTNRTDLLYATDFDFKLGNRENGHLIHAFGVPYNEEDRHISYDIRQGGFNYTGSSGLLRISSTENYYSNLLCSNINLTDLTSLKWQKFSFVTDFGGDYFGNNRDLEFYRNGDLYTKNTEAKEVRDTLVSDASEDSYKYIGFEFKANGTNNTAMGNAASTQVYYLDNIRTARISNPDVTMSGLTDVAPDGVILNFTNRVLDLSVLKNNIRIYKGTEKITNFALASLNGGYSVKVIAPFLGNTEYKIEVLKSYKDVYRVSSLMNREFTFTTGTPAAFDGVISTPSETANVSSNAKQIKVDFTTAVTSDDFKKAVNVVINGFETNAYTVSASEDLKTYYIIFNSGFGVDNDYVVTISPTLKDINSAALGKTLTKTFTTENIVSSLSVLANDTFETEADVLKWTGSVSSGNVYLADDPIYAGNKCMAVKLSQSGTYSRTIENDSSDSRGFYVSFKYLWSKSQAETDEHMGYVSSLVVPVDSNSVLPYNYYVGGNSCLRLNGTKNNASLNTVYNTEWTTVETVTFPQTGIIKYRLNGGEWRFTETDKTVADLFTQFKITAVSGTSENKELVMYIDDVVAARIPPLSVGILSEDGEAYPKSTIVDVDPSSAIKVKFSVPVSEESLKAGLRLMKNGEFQNYNMYYVLSDDKTQADITVDGLLEYNTAYSLYVGEALSGSYGTAVQNPKTIEFTTQKAKSVNIVDGVTSAVSGSDKVVTINIENPESTDITVFVSAGAYTNTNKMLSIKGVYVTVPQNSSKTQTITLTGAGSAPIVKAFIMESPSRIRVYQPEELSK